MPRGYSILVGVPYVDAGSPFYSRNLPGFDGRAGCQGVTKDIRRMEALAHYFGYQPVMGESLVGPKATVGNVMAAIDALSSSEVGLGDGDHVLFYLSCHGKTMGSYRGDTRQSASVGEAVNAFLLHDGPLFNVTLFERLGAVQVKSRRTRLRVCTVIDACHAGSGGSIPPGLVKQLAHDLEDIRLHSDLFRSTLAAQAFDGAGLSKMMGGKVGLLADFQLDPALIKTSLAFALVVLQLLTRALGQLPLQMAHLGAAGDELRAEGGPTGSLFTRLLDMAIRNAERPYSYRDLHAMLVDWLPLNRRPVLERLGRFAAGEHFADRTTVFSIEP